MKKSDAEFMERMKSSTYMTNSDRERYQRIVNREPSKGAQKLIVAGVFVAVGIVGWIIGNIHISWG